MAATLQIDTLNFVRRLTGAGMDRPLAEAIVEGLAEADTSELATKTDVTACRTELQAEIAALRSELKADIAALRVEMKADKADLVRFMMLQVIAIVGLGVTLLKLLP
jgi:hypothetical protein